MFLRQQLEPVPRQRRVPDRFDRDRSVRRVEQHDTERLPRPGGVLTRTFQGKEIKVQVLDAGFGYEGKTWRSLSAIAKAVTGTSWNGFLFFGLQTRAKRPTDAVPAAKDGAK